MYQIDSDSRGGLDLALSEVKVVALPLQEEAPDCKANLPSECEVNPAQNVTQISSDRELEQFISNLLKYGVILSSAIVLVGGILYLIRHGAEPAEYQFFQGEPSVFCSPKGVVKAVLSGSRRGIIQLGLLLLIATPVARVAFSLLTFLRQRDLSYVIVTLFVLAGLIYSFIGAYS